MCVLQPAGGAADVAAIARDEPHLGSLLLSHWRPLHHPLLCLLCSLLDPIRAGQFLPLERGLSRW